MEPAALLGDDLRSGVVSTRIPNSGRGVAGFVVEEGSRSVDEVSWDDGVSITIQTRNHGMVSAIDDAIGRPIPRLANQA